VSTPVQDGGNPSDSLIHRFTDSLIPEVNHNTTAPSSTSPTKATKRGARISEHFAVTESHREFAAKHGFTSPDEVVEEFKDYWRAVPGQRGCKLDWDATFRNQLRKLGQRKRVNGNANNRNDEIIDRVAAGMAL
jgi:hypothetical protein